MKNLSRRTSLLRRKELCSAMLDVVSVNKLESCYLRPLVIRGYGNIGVMPTKDNPIETYIAAWEWGTYLGEEAARKAASTCACRVGRGWLPILCPPSRRPADII